MFNYQTVCLHILTGLLYQVSKISTVEFANKYLFNPIGITSHNNYYVKTAADHKEFIMGKAPKQNIWLCDPINVATAGYGLCLSAKDMVKIGNLCLDKGIYQEKQIISTKWIEEIIEHKSCPLERFQNSR